MPELPEAETIGRALDNALENRVITQVEVFTPAMRTSLLPLKDADLPGKKFSACAAGADICWLIFRTAGCC